MSENIITKQVKDLIIKIIRSIAKEHTVLETDIKVGIKGKNEEGEPILMIYKQNKKLKEITFKEFCGLIPTVKKFMYRGLGFNIENDLEVWIKKFIIKSGVDNNFEPNKPMYFIFINNNDLFAYMVLDGKIANPLPNFMGKEWSISLDYILQTS